MFDFFVELFDDIKKGAYRYQVSNGNSIVVEGFQSILKIEESVINLKLKSAELEILGINLKVKEITSNTIKINGKILSVKEVCNGK